MLAKVALPLPFTDYLTYSIPGQMVSLAETGTLVNVQFRNRPATGVIIGFSDEPDIPGQLYKELLSLGDPRLQISEETMALVNVASHRYATTPGIVCKAALPPGTLAVQPRYLYPGKKGMPEQTNNSSAAVIEMIEEQPGRLTISDIQRKLGGDLAGTLIRTGAVAVSPFRGAKDVRERGKERWIRAISSGAPEKLGKKAAQLFGLLRENEKGIKVVSLKQLGFSAAIATSIINKGLAEYYYLPKELSEAGGLESLPREQAPVLTLWQEAALNKIASTVKSERSGGFLLYGVTSSGKTQVYLEAARTALSMGKSVLVLVPEISLTPQIISRFERFLGKRPLLWHSHLSPGDRLAAYLTARTEGPALLIGTRSAVFAPLEKLGLIVVDEEQDHSYKQDDPSPRYNARDLALERGALENATVVLGSATPSAETYHMARSGKIEMLTLPQRVAGTGSPRIEIVSTAFNPEPKPSDIPVFPRGFRPVSEKLYEEISIRLKQREQVIILLNRRGYSSTVVCFECGWIGKCPDCQIGWTYHKAKDRMLCHFCGKSEKGPLACAKCGSTRLSFRSAGTERLEETLRHLLPDARMVRLDTDAATRKQESRDILDDFGAGKYQILLGTQMVAKGHHFPSVGLVGIVSADIGLSLPDFRASERVLQLLIQAAGRAGRSTRTSDHGMVIVQTFSPENPLLGYLKADNFIGFLDDELKLREQLGYPPFKRLALVVVSSPYAHRAADGAERLKDEFMARLADMDIGLLGPAESPIFKRGKLYRYQLLIKMPPDLEVSELMFGINDFMKRSKGMTIKIDIDPVSFM